MYFFFSSRRRHTRLTCDWSSDVCSSDLERQPLAETARLQDITQRVGHVPGAAESNRLPGRGAAHLEQARPHRSEERRVGKECGGRCTPYHDEEKIMECYVRSVSSSVRHS